MAYQQWNGCDIVPLPELPGLKEISIDKHDSVSDSASPYTRVTQVQWWPGADFLTGSFSLPVMPMDVWAAWDAWQGEMRGRANVFQLGHPLRALLMGTGNVAAGAITVRGAHSGRGIVLHTAGWTPNAVGVMLPGDHFQLGLRLHIVGRRVDADANGFADIYVYPTLRDALVGGEPLILHDAQGLWRLASNVRGGSTDVSHLTTVQVVKFEEAR